MSFLSLGLSKALSESVSKLGYQQPTPIQSQTIPAVLKGTDVIATAETGSGKTASFSLPLIHKFTQQNNVKNNIKNNHVLALVLVPTRELAVQVEQAIQQYASTVTDFKVCTVYGGVSINTQMQALRGGCHILVATPGRLLDLHQRNAVSFDSLSVLVLDEADRMLDLGFSEELHYIIRLLPTKRQSLFFSATFPEKVRILASKLLHNPIEITINEQGDNTLTAIPEQIKHRAIEVDRNNRTMLLKHLLKTESWPQLLVFVGSKRSANNVAQKLARDKFNVKTLHGDLSQSERSAALKDFKNGKCRILIATDLAARGIDIPELPCVLNYDLPRSTADYVHRIGRSGRAGAKGLAISLIDHDSDAHFKLIQKRYQLNITREQVVGFERSSSASGDAVKPKGQAPVKGKRMSKKDKLRAAQAAKTKK